MPAKRCRKRTELCPHRENSLPANMASVYTARLTEETGSAKTPPRHEGMLEILFRFFTFFKDADHLAGQADAVIAGRQGIAGVP